MATQCTAALAGQLQALNLDPAQFSAEFDAWKALGANGEFQNYLFGKDGAYIAPSVGGSPYLLRHVHLAPLADYQALNLWNIAWQRRSRKTSNRVLVYASSTAHGHLLIFILNEPDAHAIAQMRTAQHRATMHGMAEVAGHFLHDGSNTA